MDNKSTSTRRERQNAARIEQILDAAIRLFAEKGFHRTTTRDIAEAADVAEGTLYNYFANKDDLLFGIMQRLTESMTFDAMHTEALPTADTREHFIALLQTYRDFQYQNASILQALLSEILANTELRQRYYQQLLEPSILALEKDLAKHSQLGQIRSVDIPAYCPRSDQYLHRFILFRRAWRSDGTFESKRNRGCYHSLRLRRAGAAPGGLNRDKAVFIKNLLRRKIRTLLTVLGIAIGVAAIVALGALTNSLQAGYGSMLQGSKADLVLSQPNAMDISYSTVDEEIGKELEEAPEVSEVSAMLQGFTAAEDQPFFFIFGYPDHSFIMPRFKIKTGARLDSHEAVTAHGKPVLLGSAAAEILDKSVGDTLRLTGSIYRIIGIYETGDAFEDSGAVMSLKDAQELLGRQRQVSLYYIRLKEPAMRERFLARVERQWPDFSVSGIKEFSEEQSMTDMMSGFVWAIGGLAIVIGGVGMMNSQLMAIMERTREIGVLRAVGWSSKRVLWMILMESILVCLLGGLFGISIAYLLISDLSRNSVVMGVNTRNVTQDLLVQAMSVVLILGLVGGLYPAWRASQLQPVEALRYEGGSSGSRIRRLPFGGMAVQSLWQRSGRTFLTLGVIGLTVGAIMALESMVAGMTESMTDYDLWIGCRDHDPPGGYLGYQPERNRRPGDRQDRCYARGAKRKWGCLHGYHDARIRRVLYHPWLRAK